jgi:hypothetical protein
MLAELACFEDVQLSSESVEAQMPCELQTFLLIGETPSGTSAGGEETTSSKGVNLGVLASLASFGDDDGAKTKLSRAKSAAAAMATAFDAKAGLEAHLRELPAKSSEWLRRAAKSYYDNTMGELSQLVQVRLSEALDKLRVQAEDASESGAEALESALTSLDAQVVAVEDKILAVHRAVSSVDHSLEPLLWKVRQFETIVEAVAYANAEKLQDAIAKTISGTKDLWLDKLCAPPAAPPVPVDGTPSSRRAVSPAVDAPARLG